MEGKKCDLKVVYVVIVANVGVLMVNTQYMESGWLGLRGFKFWWFGGFMICKGVSGEVCKNMGVGVWSCVGSGVMVPFIMRADECGDSGRVCLGCKSCPMESSLSIGGVMRVCKSYVGLLMGECWA